MSGINKTNLPGVYQDVLTTFFPHCGCYCRCGLRSRPARNRPTELWPSKPVRIIVNFAHSGSTDNAPHSFADRLSRALGQQFVIENKPGDFGTIGIELGTKAAPDGYTFFTTGSPVITVVPQARKVALDPLKDMVPVAYYADYTMAISVLQTLGINSIKELVDYANAIQAR
ncbi:MAG: hypothetical protein EXR05_02120 [Acetobacteraceae bacterium]|nr:hypothetical protein [Acetobacteraceae bacterium]MSP29487.1 hypothetical protein [Acetobacteraceae bacterium]